MVRGMDGEGWGRNESKIGELKFEEKKTIKTNAREMMCLFRKRLFDRVSDQINP